MDSSLYSQSKVLWHTDRLDDLRAGIPFSPVHVQLILSDLCNQDCHFCAYRMSAGLSRELFGGHNPHRHIPTDKAREIIEDCAEIGVKAIQFTGGGEPTVHKDHIELFEVAQWKGMETALVTNGIKLRLAQPIMNMKWIRVSIDAGTAETYAQIRNVNKAHWDKVWNNIAALHNYGGELGVGFVVTNENYYGLIDCIDKAIEFGVDNLRIGAVFSKDGIHYYDGHLERITDIIKAAKEIKGIKIIDMFGRRLNDLEGGHPEDPFCGYQHFTTYIGGDLSVYRCCNTAYTRHGFLGSLKEQRFRDFKPDYDSFDARDCSYCQFRGQNEAITSALDKPQHGNFV